MKVDFHPEAVEEAILARQWYGDRSESAGRQFQQAFDAAIDRLAESPTRWPEGPHQTRFLTVERFPYLVVYRIQGNEILVVAVAHANRRPGYWKQRC